MHGCRLACQACLLERHHAIVQLHRALSWLLLCMQAFEKVKAIRLVTELFSVDNGLLTPTFKIKRPALRQKYTEEISKLYNELSQRATNGPQIF